MLMLLNIQLYVLTIKWSVAKAIKDKPAPTAASFLYEIVYQHGCIKIRINDQGKKFVNQVAESLHKMTRIEQKITSTYYPKSNGLCEGQNRTIKDSLIKLLEQFFRFCITQNALQWPFFFFSSLSPSRQCFWTDRQKLFSNICQIAALSACDQDRK